jgi:hypothetical protein
MSRIFAYEQVGILRTEMLVPSKGMIMDEEPDRRTEESQTGSRSEAIRKLDRTRPAIAPRLITRRLITRRLITRRLIAPRLTMPACQMVPGALGAKNIVSHPI